MPESAWIDIVVRIIDIGDAPGLLVAFLFFLIVIINRRLVYPWTHHEDIVRLYQQQVEDLRKHIDDLTKRLSDHHHHHDDDAR